MAHISGVFAIYVALVVGVYFMIPSPLFSDPISTVVYDRNGELLGARIAGDGQWRFPDVDSVPRKYEASLLCFEDRYFRMHPGVNPGSMIRALGQNLSAGEIVSGGSTITMQVIRMSRNNPDRTIGEKLKESILALRLELTLSKQEILEVYASNAPFGGNVVGIEAASWRYFGTSPYQLTWSESALLAVLPNAPSLIHPGRNRGRLLEKRNTLLRQLHEQGVLDGLTLELALEEPLPEKPLPLPSLAPHLTDHYLINAPGERHLTTLDRELQDQVMRLAAVRQEALMANEIHNMACIVLEVATGNVLAYMGNGVNDPTMDHGNQVDLIRAERSTGSILKPLLYAGMLDNGDLLQGALIPDVPIRYDGYAPKNYNRDYEGAVPAFKALERSLNIPSVIMLERYGIEPFLSLLRNLGFSTFRRDHEYYGLTLILGGAETTLWELAGVYSSMARSLLNYTGSNGNYFSGDYHMPRLKKGDKTATNGVKEEGLLSASSIYITFKSLLDVNRPDAQTMWYLMNSSRPIAWKTGTSYGFRDAWAVGVTPEYLVAVWSGNADGEGRPGLSGVRSAAPMMFDVFDLLPETSWFDPPLDDLEDAPVCRESGYLAGPHCNHIDTIAVVPKGLKSKVCPFHATIHLDSSGSFRVGSDCYPVHQMKNASWFILPPQMEWYYLRNEATYRSLPPLMEGCTDPSIDMLEIIYPKWNSHLVIPRELDGSKGKVVLEVSHRDRNATLYWHIDETYVGNTHSSHQLAMDIPPGFHALTVTDEAGNSKQVKFEVLR